MVTPTSKHIFKNKQLFLLKGVTKENESVLI